MTLIRRFIEKKHARRPPRAKTAGFAGNFRGDSKYFALRGFSRRSAKYLLRTSADLTQGMIGGIILSIFEALMLLCFGAAWPVNIYKSVRTASAKGKSPFFLVIILLGYVSGIINKLLYSRDVVMYLYILNLVMVSADLLLYFRNRALDKKRSENKENSD